jgi:hypothetical protein
MHTNSYLLIEKWFQNILNIIFHRLCVRYAKCYMQQPLNFSINVKQSSRNI